MRVETTKGRVLLKVCNEKPEDLLLLQCRFLEQCRAAGVFTCFPVHRRDGGSLTKYGDLNIICYDFLEGGLPTSLNERAVEHIGVSLAKVHALPVLEEYPGFSMGYVEAWPFLDEIKDAPLGSTPFAAELRYAMQYYKPLISRTDLPRGLIHGDVFVDNLIAVEAEKVAIVDWEEICVDLLALDVVVTWIGCCYDERPEQHAVLNQKRVDAFTAGYESVRPLLPIERESLQGLLAYSLVSIAFWRFRQFNWRHPQLAAARGESYREMMKRLRDLPCGRAHLPADFVEYL
eukprot:TRINITY_DN4842_c0_g1_i2.p1 TRINITY_DN4842_c0_g1~~TRINITY_DN4842_c0_g1_i2.p1  ORF type:complete len:289 (-),score=81.98 TRINITY_DN4842_c0_g1_i2:20-886(-)